MKKLLLALSLGATALAGAVPLLSPAAAQSAGEERRWRDAEARYQAEFERYLAERDRYVEARLRDRYGPGYGGYRGAPPPPPGYYENGAPPPPPPPGYYEDDEDDEDWSTDYDAAGDYREGPQYRERVLSAEDEVYRGSDGRLYCRRSDGTTGLIVGGAGGAILGNVIDGGRHRAAGTLIGGALGAILGSTVERNQQVRCR